MSAHHHIKKVLILTALSLFAAGAFLKAQAASSFEITSPTPDSTIIGNSVQFSFSLPTNISLTDFATHPKSTYGQGHIHLWIDQQNPSRQNAIEVTSPTYVLDNLKSGPHTVVAQLVTNSHTDLLPKAESTVNFTLSMPISASSPFSLPVFQISIITVILIIISLYFITYHIKPHLHKKIKKSRHS